MESKEQTQEQNRDPWKTVAIETACMANSRTLPKPIVVQSTRNWSG